MTDTLWLNHKPRHISLFSYVIISNFVYLKDRYSKEYGWGVAEYSTPEKFFGESFTSTVYQREPEESHQRILEYFHEILPDTPDQALSVFLR